MADIKSFPDHILIEIFQKLSPKMIKTSCLVCKRWNEIIADSASLMEKFQLNLYWTDEKRTAAKEIRKKYQSASVKDLETDSLDIISSLNLKSLDLTYANFKVSSLIEALIKLPALKNLVATCAIITDDVSSAEDFKKIRTNLKELRWEAALIHIFECCTIETLELGWITEENYDSEVVVDFLSQQKDLHELELCTKQVDDLFSSKEVFEPKFSLKTLKVNCNGPFLHYQEFIRFLQRHQHSLTSLNIEFYTEPQYGIDEIHSFAIEHLRNLKHLKLGYYNLSLENNKMSFRDLTPEKHTAMNIESLVFCTEYELDGTKRFFELLRNLKRLDFEGPHTVEDAQLLHYISAINFKLEMLNIWMLKDQNLSHIYFPNLKELSVDGKWDEMVLCDFINRHSGILERIYLFDAIYMTELEAKEIMNCGNLKSLKLVTFHSSLPCLKWLRDASSFTINIELGFDSDINQKERFIFPDDRAIWDQKMKSLIEEELNN